MALDPRPPFSKVEEYPSAAVVTAVLQLYFKPSPRIVINKGYRIVTRIVSRNTCILLTADSSPNLSAMPSVLDTLDLTPWYQCVSSRQ